MSTVIQYCWSIGRVYIGNLRVTSVLSSISAEQRLVIQPTLKVLFIGGYLATHMNSTNVESESYSDYFNPMADISDDTLPKKLKPDNMIGTLS